jgi:thiamine biosynthesis lipoprotein
MGVETRIVLFGASDSRTAAAIDAAYAELERLERAFSDWRNDSEIARLAERAGSGPVPVSRELYELLQRARAVSAASDGAFDVTVGPLVALWRASRRTGRLPDADELARARELVGWRLLELDERTRTVALARPGMRLDLGGIAKGYAGQRALATLARAGYERALVQLGGDIACGAPPPGHDGWEVDVAGERVRLAHTSVSTSGDTEQHVVIDGVRYSHVVDPRTGLGTTARTVVTVAARDGALADALATALGVHGALDRPALLGAFDARVLGFERE